jgi:hypothetical protein
MLALHTVERNILIDSFIIHSLLESTNENAECGSGEAFGAEQKKR